MSISMNNLEKYKIKLKKNDVLCMTGDINHDLYYIISGNLLICVNQKRQITPIAYLGPNEYLGELSFIDHMDRSAHIIAFEDSEVLRIPSAEFKTQVPRWLRRIAKKITAKIRLMDEIIQQNGIRKKNVESIQPLSIEDQRTYFNSLEEYKKKNNQAFKP